ncbi:MAG: rhomboid family intramembrane serine protease [Gemmataceae bacterium]|nr:rhomboid family intramembrane serine protease [Gemmataceae bacterium]
MGIHDRDYYRKEGPSLLAHWEDQGKVCTWLIGINIAFFVVQLVTRSQVAYGYFREPVTDALSLDVQKVMRGEAWRLLTAAFLHSTSGFLHILFNMLFLWWFGRDVEERLGAREFLGFYLVAALASSLGFVAAAQAGFHGGPNSVGIGASGAVTAVLLLSAIYRPDQIIYLSFILPVPIWAFVAFSIARDAFGLFGHGGHGVATSAHLAGAAFGLLYYRFDWNLTGWLKGWGTGTGKKANARLRIYRPEDEAAAPVAAPAPSRIADEHLEAQMDDILAKVSRVGMTGLTEAEKQVLLRASAAVRKKQT